MPRQAAQAVNQANKNSQAQQESGSMRDVPMSLTVTGSLRSGCSSLGTYPLAALPAVRLLPPPSQVGRVGLVAKKGVVQGVSRPATGGSTCSSSNASSASFVMLLNGAPAHRRCMQLRHARISLSQYKPLCGYCHVYPTAMDVSAMLQQCFSNDLAMIQQ